ncbi:MAG: hypothetical protein NTV68_02465 [Methanomicrobiales archaeon]|nr:hypothetical protein [Methanomicrobiales archaeon]
MTGAYNKLPESGKRSIFCIIIEVVHEPMFILLVACGLIYFVIGDISESMMMMMMSFSSPSLVLPSTWS